MRIPGFRHKWVDSIDADQRTGPPFTVKGNPVVLVAVQRPRRIFRPKKTIFIYRINHNYYYADDLSDFRFIPFDHAVNVEKWNKLFIFPTPQGREWLKLNNYVLASDLTHE